MSFSRRTFIKRFGVALASLLLSNCATDQDGGKEVTATVEVLCYEIAPPTVVEVTPTTLVQQTKVLSDVVDGGGVNPEATRLAICTRPLGKAMHPGRQHMITQAGVISFFTAQFAEDPEERRTAREYLRSGIGADFPEASTTF